MEYVDSFGGFTAVAGTDGLYLQNGRIVVRSDNGCIIKPHERKSGVNKGNRYYRLRLKDGRRTEWSFDRVFGLVKERDYGVYAKAYANTDWSNTSVRKAAKLNNVSQSGFNKWMRKHHPECCKTRDELSAEKSNAKLDYIPSRIIGWCDGFIVKKRTGNTTFELQCRQCGSEFERCVSVGKYRVTCDECEAKRREAHRFANAQQLKIMFPATPYEPMDRTQVVNCAICGKAFRDQDWMDNGWVKSFARFHQTCSPACQNALHRKRQAGKITQPWWLVAKHYNTFDCALCGERVDPNDYRITENGAFVAGAKYPSTDHIIEWCISHDGSMENSQLAHCECNWKKEAARTKIGGAA